MTKTIMEKLHYTKYIISPMIPLSLFILLTPNHVFSQPVTLIILFSVIILTFPVWVWEICVFLKTSESQSKVKLLKTLLLVTPILLFGLIWDTFISLIPNLPNIYIASACFNLFIVIVGYSLSHHLVSAYETLENLFPAMKEIVAEKVKLQAELEAKAAERNSEINAILSESNQIFISFDKVGKITHPISPDAEEFFGYDVEGGKISNTLFPYVLPGSRHFEYLKNEIFKVFTNKEIFFEEYSQRLPSKIHIKTKDDFFSADVNYSSIYGEKGITKVLCLIKKSDREEYEKLKKGDTKFRFLSEIRDNSPAANKKFQENLSKVIGVTFYFLCKLNNPTENTPEEMNKVSLEVYSNLKETGERNAFIEVINPLLDEIKQELKFAKNTSLNHSNLYGLFRETSNLLKSLLEYNTFLCQEVEVVDSGVNTNMDLDDNYTKINSCISNLLEYCFVVRNKNLGELDDEEISKAARHIRVASKHNFTEVIAALKKSLILQHFYHETQDDLMEAGLYELFVTELEKLPKPESITESDLIKHLINPFGECVASILPKAS